MREYLLLGGNMAAAHALPSATPLNCCHQTSLLEPPPGLGQTHSTLKSRRYGISKRPSCHLAKIPSVTPLNCHWILLNEATWSGPPATRDHQPAARGHQPATLGHQDGMASYSRSPLPLCEGGVSESPVVTSLPYV